MSKYMHLFAPAVEWILQCVAHKVNDVSIYLFICLFISVYLSVYLSVSISLSIMYII